MGFSGLSQDTLRLFIVISEKLRLAGGPGMPYSVLAEILSDSGPSPAGLKADMEIV